MLNINALQNGVIIGPLVLSKSQRNAIVGNQMIRDSDLSMKELFGKEFFGEFDLLRTSGIRARGNHNAVNTNITTTDIASGVDRSLRVLTMLYNNYMSHRSALTSRQRALLEFYHKIDQESLIAGKLHISLTIDIIDGAMGCNIRGISTLLAFLL